MAIPELKNTCARPAGATGGLSAGTSGRGALAASCRRHTRARSSFGIHIGGGGKKIPLLAVYAAALLVNGCGTLPPILDETVDLADRSETADEEPASAPAAPALPPAAPSPASSPSVGGHVTGADRAFVPDLLTAFVDLAILELLDPVAPSSGFTFLELLCRDIGEPDFVCRRRYGP